MNDFEFFTLRHVAMLSGLHMSSLMSYFDKVAQLGLIKKSSLKQAQDENKSIQRLLGHKKPSYVYTLTLKGVKMRDHLVGVFELLNEVK